MHDHPGWFCAVGGDMKVKQTIQRLSKGPGGHVVVGAKHKANAVAEFELLFDEIGMIIDVLKFLTNNFKTGRMPSPACTEYHSLPYIQPKCFKAAGICARVAESILSDNQCACSTA